MPGRCRVQAVGKSRHSATCLLFRVLAGRHSATCLLCRVLAGRHSAKPEHVPSTRAHRAPPVRGADGVNSLPSASSWHSAKVKYCRVSPAGTRQSRNVAECTGVALGKASFAECWCPVTRQTWLKKIFGPSNFFGLHLNLIM